MRQALSVTNACVHTETTARWKGVRCVASQKDPRIWPFFGEGVRNDTLHAPGVDGADLKGRIVTY